jgi:fimbrial isopeptide formation D2 family protein
MVPVTLGSCRNGSGPAAPFVPLPPPVCPETAAPINLSNPVPLYPALQVNQGDPLFLKLTDLDQNLDRTARETVTVTITDAESGDTEIILLTETGPDTGIFVGYTPTGDASTTPFSGTLTVTTGSSLTSRYVDAVDGSDTVATTILVDPNGVVFDSSSGAPVNGATITLIDNATGLPATVYGDNGVSSYPATLITGGAVTDGSGKTYSFPPGGYWFPFIQPGTYRYLLTPPGGYTAPSPVATATLQTLPGAPFSITNGSRGEAFAVNPGPALRIDIPIDPQTSSLWLQKSAGKNVVGHGDFVPYQLTVTNTNKLSPVIGVTITDTLPSGLRFRTGSLLVNGTPSPDPAVSADGRVLTMAIGTLAAETGTSISYVVEVTAGARVGTAINNAVATSISGIVSPSAQATIHIRDDFLRTRSTLMGRVSTGACNTESGDGSDGVEGVRIYLEDGTFVTSDKRGLFHFEGIRPGLHVVQLDLDSLPDGFIAVPCTENSRFSGRAFSQFVETQGGTLWRTDFHIRGPVGQRQHAAPPAEAFPSQPEPAADLPAVQTFHPNPPATPAIVPVIVPLKGEAALELSNRIDGTGIAYLVTMRTSTLPLRSALMKVILPEGVRYEPGSSHMDGTSVTDPILRDGGVLEYPLGELPAAWKHKITFMGRPVTGNKNGALATRAYLAAEGPDGAAVLTPAAEASVVRDSSTKTIQLPGIILRPHFPTFGAELNAEDREHLDELARLLKALNADSINVTGHTDAVRIAPRSRAIYKDNFDLSLARAGSVGRYLMEKLHLPPEKLTFDGKGPTVPIASNRTAEGKALNRRVEVQTATSRTVDSSRLRVLKEFSGEQRVETATRAAAGIPVADSRGMLLTSPTAAGTAAVTTGIPTGSSSAQPGAGAAASTAPLLLPAEVPPAAVSAVAPSEPKTVGILNVADGDLMINRIVMIRARIDTALTPKLLLDGREIPDSRIGMRSQENGTGKTGYSYLGVDLGPEGDHTLILQGVDPFGNARFSERISLKRTGEIATIRLVSADGNIADGKTPVRMRLELRDSAGSIVSAAAELEMKDGTLRPLLRDAVSLEEKVTGRRLLMNNDGWVEFEPVNISGPYRITIGSGKATVEVETYVQPDLRDWILVGLAEGTLGYNTASGNMESLGDTGVSEDLYHDDRVALYARGQIKGKWLLTTAYDSAKAKGENRTDLFQTINPDTYYTLYGDASQQQYDAASAKKLYVKIEREQFYAMFGDYDTGLTVTELSRYSRRMTGIKSELQNRNYEFNLFASETDQAFMRDEIPGDGTSGIYRLSRTRILPNSEKITIETRDRFRSEIVLSSRTLGRFTEYSIDYETGGIFFKEPVFSRDEHLNPITIVAEYETLSSGRLDYSYGGHVGVKLLDQRLKVGGSYVHEGQGVRVGNLYGLDTSLKLGEGTRIRAEFASSDYNAGRAGRTGSAYLAEVTHTAGNVDIKSYFREQGTGFGLGQQSGGESGTRKFGADGTYRFSKNYSTQGSAYRQYNLASGAVRDVAEGRFGYNTAHSGVSLGVLYADDRLGDGSSHTSTQVTAGGKILTLNDRLTLTVDHAQSIGNNSNSDFPTRTTFGAEFRIFRNLTLLAAQEFTWGSGATTQNSRLGMRSTPWQGATITSSVERQFSENSERVFANVGMKQAWQINENWKADAGVDRSQTLAASSRYQFNTSVPPASGGTENFTAVSTGATYQIKQLTWDNRAEFRFADREDKWGVMSGMVNEVNGQWAWSGRAQIFQTSAATGADTTQANLRHGLVFRPPRTDWMMLNRLDYYIDSLSGGATADTTSWRLVNNLNANYRPVKEFQLSLHYGAKYVRDVIGETGYGGFTDFIGGETRYDITKQWDIGLRGSVMHSWSGSQRAYSCGPSAGYNVVENVWISIGYNVWGFEDKDYSAAAYTAQGPYVRFRMKFDQQTIKDAAGWLNKQ